MSEDVGSKRRWIIRLMMELQSKATRGMRWVMRGLKQWTGWKDGEVRLGVMLKGTKGRVETGDMPLCGFLVSISGDASVIARSSGGWIDRLEMSTTGW